MCFLWRMELMDIHQNVDVQTVDAKHHQIDCSVQVIVEGLQAEPYRCLAPCSSNRAATAPR